MGDPVPDRGIVEQNGYRPIFLKIAPSFKNRGFDIQLSCRFPS